MRSARSQPSADAEAYLMSRVEFEPNTGCWLWARGWTSDGYGSCKVAGYSRKAHRMSWELHQGPIPAGLSVLHRCDTPACVNPDHLRVGTHRENMEDCGSRGRIRQGYAPWGRFAHTLWGLPRAPDDPAQATDQHLEAALRRLRWCSEHATDRRVKVRAEDLRLVLARFSEGSIR